MSKKTKNERKVGGANGAVVPAREQIPGGGGGDRNGVSGPTGLERYLDHVAHLDMPVEMKIQLISALYDMMRSFVDRAFGDDPVQRALHRDNQNKTDTDKRPGMLKSEIDKHNQSKHLTHGFRRNAGPREEKATEQ